MAIFRAFALIFLVDESYKFIKIIRSLLSHLEIFLLAFGAKFGAFSKAEKVLSA
jgi:hypothetical protein